MQKVLDFIKRRWPETTRIHRTAEGTLLDAEVEQRDWRLYEAYLKTED